MGGLQIIIILVIFTTILGIGIMVVRNQEAARQKRILSVIQGRNKGTSKSGADEKDAQNKRRAEIAQKLKDGKVEEDGKKNKAAPIVDMIARAGLTITPKKFWINSIIFAVIFTAFVTVVFKTSIFVSIMSFVIGLLGLPKMFLKRKAAKRQKKFLEGFADALEAVVRLLKAGMPISEAVAMMSREFGGPIGEEMGLIYDKQKIGIPLHEAAIEGAHRMPITEMYMFATGLSIQAQTGSSLSEVLLNLAKVIRGRYRLKRKIKALSSEAIASASIIAALPILVASGLWFVNPEYIGVLFTDSFGKVLLGGAVFWMAMGVLSMKIMINFKV